jgi:glycerophosphoryl diester phosphodiesterase
MMTVPARLDEVPRDADVVVVCRVGARSRTVVGYLLAQGWDRVRNLDGGMVAWEQAGRPWPARTDMTHGSSDPAETRRPARLRPPRWRGRPPGAHPRRLSAGHRRGCGRARVRRPADPGRPSRLHSRPAAQPHQQRRGLVSTSTLAELTELDFGSWHVPHEGDADPAEAGVLTLDVLLEAVRGAGRPLRMLIETKHRRGMPGPWSGRSRTCSAGTALPAPDAGVQVTVMSFSMLALARMRALAPGMLTAYLVDIPAAVVADRAVAVRRPVFGPRWRPCAPGPVGAARA